MKFVRETYFEKNQDPKKSMNTGLLGDIKRMGVEIPDFNTRTNWDNDDKERATQFFKEDLPKFHHIIVKLIEAGVEPKNIRINDGTTIAIDCFEVVDGNHVILNALTYEDAEILIKTVSLLEANQRYESRWKIDKTSLSHYIYVNGDNLWLDNYVENRKKLKSIL